MCPHGSNSNPENCSQCLGLKPTKIEILDGILYINGVNNGLVSVRNRENIHQESQNTLPQKRKTCSNCGKPGHNVKTCTEDKKMIEYE